MHRLAYFLTVTLVLFLGGCAAASKPLATAPDASASVKQHNEEGIQHFNMGHWDVAKTHFEAAVEADPTQPEPHYNLALALHKMGKHEEATAHFKKAAELDSSNTTITGSSVYKSHVKPAGSSSGY